MVDMKMMTRRPVLFANVTGMFAGFALFGSFILIPNFVQTPPRFGYGFGADALTTGLYLLPSAAVGFFSGPLAGVLGARYGALAFGMLIGGVGVAMLAEWHDEPWHIVLGMLVLGAGVPASFAAMAKVIVDSVRQSETGIATGMNTVMRTVGGVVGGQVSAAILTSDTILGTNVPAESAYTTAFAIAAVGSLVAAFAAVLVTPLRRLPPRDLEVAAEVAGD
jgi:hypothetical protein